MTVAAAAGLPEVTRLHVFVSFSSHDVALAGDLVAELERRGARAFFAPRDIRPSENFAQRIVQAIVECDTVVVMLSAAAIESPHVRREVSLAIDERRRIFPIVLSGVEFPRDFSSEWAYWLSAVQVHRFEGLDQLVAVVLDAPQPVAGPSRSAEVEAAPAGSAGVQAPEVLSPVVLLRPERRIVPFVGRAEELTRLQSWLARDDRISVRLVTAPAGEGKSRLAEELSDVAVAGGWNVTRPRPSDPPASSAAAPLLVVVDYAETKTAMVAQVLQGLTRAPFGHRVRVLLLARSSGDWWRSLSSEDAELEELLADATVQKLPTFVDDPDGRRAVYGEAIEAFAGALGVAVPRTALPPDAPASLLDLLQRALLSVLSDSDEGSQGRVVARLLGHEQRYVRSAADTDLAAFDDADFERAVVLFSLFPPNDEPEAVRLVGWALPSASPVESRRMARLFRRLYPSEARYSSGLKPDVVAELALARLLDEDGRVPGGQSTWELVDLAQFENGLRVAARAAATEDAARRELVRLMPGLDPDRLRVAIRVALQVEQPESLVAAIRAAVEAGAFDERLDELLDALPEETIALADLAAVVAARVAPESDDQLVDDEAAGQLLLSASNRFSDAGWSERALAAATRGIDVLRRVGAGQQEHVLFSALSNLSNRLWETGELDAALQAAESGLHEQTARTDPLDIMAAHSNLAFRLIELGRYPEAETALDAAMEAGAAFDDENPRARIRRQAVMLNRLCLASGLGRWDEAVAMADELIARRREDYAGQRDRFIAYLARALADAAVPYAMVGRADDALASVVEARTLQRLTAGRAPIFRFEAAESALIEAAVSAILDRQEGIVPAVEAARAEVALTGPSVGSLGTRLSAAIDAFAPAAGQGALRAIGSPDAPTTLRFPLLLEYKDL